jgi:phage-related protein
LKGKYTSTYAKYNIDKLAEMPGQLFGSAQQLAKSVDKILGLPVGIINDIYKGYTKLMGEVNDFINSLFEVLQTFFNSILDNLFPGLTEFLTQLTAFANQIGGIAQIFGAQTQVLGFTNQIIQGANQLNSFIQNPLDAAFAFAPEQLSQGLYTLQNPQQLINQYLPPQLSEYFSKIESITGFGFNGNMGFGLQNVLEGFQNGVLSGILQGFATQFSILSPIFSGVSDAAPPSFTNEAGTKSTRGIEYNVDKTSGQVLAGAPEPVYGRTS